MRFEVHEKIINYFVNELKREPMEGFASVNLDQLAVADRELHVRLAEKTRAGFRPGPNGELPLDIATEEVLQAADLRWMLMPRPKGPPLLFPRWSLTISRRKLRCEPASKAWPAEESALGSVILASKEDGFAQLPSAEPHVKRKRCSEDILANGPYKPMSKDTGHKDDLLHLRADVEEVEPSFLHENLSGAPDLERGPFLLEVFSGTAGVTAAFKQLGGQALGLDHHVDKNRMKGPISKIDLCKKENQSLALEFTRNGSVDAIMAKQLSKYLRLSVQLSGMEKELRRSMDPQIEKVLTQHFSKNGKVGNDPEIAAAVYEDTMQQVEDGWLLGPLTAQQLDDKYGGCWIPSNRFGVLQGGKVRAVDDFSEFLINSSVSTSERLTLYGIDEVVNTGRMFLGLSAIEGDSCTGAWWQNSSVSGLGRSIVRDPFFESVALPFGAVSAVMAFNRMAHALRIIMAELFYLVNANFFDDFCQLEDKALADSAWTTAEMVMKLLGWRISTSEEKRLPFSEEFNMLGAVVDLKGASGRLLYAAGHTFGRSTHLAVQAISRVAMQGRKILVSKILKEALLLAVSNLLNAGPRKIDACSGKRPVLVFTDGAAEENGSLVTHGAVLWDCETANYFYFGDNVPGAWVDRWTAHGRKQVIGQAEIFPVVVAKKTWCDILESRMTLWFLDNSSALHALIRSYSPVVENQNLLCINAKYDSAVAPTNWYARVPSSSNLADGPSRLEFSEVESLGFVRCKPRYPDPHE
eukprot:s1454_g15.t1